MKMLSELRQSLSTSIPDGIDVARIFEKNAMFFTPQPEGESNTIKSEYAGRIFLTFVKENMMFVKKNKIWIDFCIFFVVIP